MLVVCI